LSIKSFLLFFGDDCYLGLSRRHLLDLLVIGCFQLLFLVRDFWFFSANWTFRSSAQGFIARAVWINLDLSQTWAGQWARSWAGGNSGERFLGFVLLFQQEVVVMPLGRLAENLIAACLRERFALKLAV
jgi:hypothetical protein